MTELQTAGGRPVAREFTVTISVDMTRLHEAFRSASASMHRLILVMLRGPALREHQLHCKHCPDLPGRPRPLRVDGHDYRRRVKARRRRNR